MKKTLILSSSPRRGGNSDTLCNEFLRGAREAGFPAEKIFLGDKAIRYCTGCSVCSLYGKPCPQKDDMSEILDKMLAADVIVMATPVYFYTMSAQMKTLIDRCCGLYTQPGQVQRHQLVAVEQQQERRGRRILPGWDHVDADGAPALGVQRDVPHAAQVLPAVALFQKRRHRRSSFRCRQYSIRAEKWQQKRPAFRRGAVYIWGSVVDVVEDALALLGQAQQVAGQRLDEVGIILLVQIGLERFVLLGLFLQLLGQGRLLRPDVPQAPVDVDDLHAHHHDEDGQHQQQYGVGLFLAGLFLRHGCPLPSAAGGAAFLSPL